MFQRKPFFKSRVRKLVKICKSRTATKRCPFAVYPVLIIRYDHLTEVLNKILAERPENVIDFFEEYSRKVKEKRFRPMTDHLEDVYIPPQQYEMAKKLMTLLKVLHLLHNN